MNSYTFGINTSWWWFALTFLITLLFVIYIYRYTIPPVSNKKKILLITLRLISVLLLIFILFEPILSIVSGRKEPPVLAVLLDNSLSIAMDDAKGNRKKIFQNSLNNSGILKMNNEQIDFNIFDLKTRSLENPDIKQLDFKGQKTDISKALESIKNKLDKKNIQTVLIISDGSFNSGNNPVYIADVLGKPIYTIGIGDTTEPKDLSIQSILTNDILYINNPAPININIKTHGYNKGQLKVELYDNGNKIDEQKFTINPDKQDFTAIFEYNPKSEGIHKLTAKLNSFPGEITLKNNSMNNFVEVLKNEYKITLFAGSPSPDVSFIKNILYNETKQEIKTFVQKNTNEFYEGMPTEKEFKNTELFILIGYPINSSNPDIMNKIKLELQKGKSLFFIASRDINYNLLRIIDDYLPFVTTSSKPMEFLVTTSITKGSMLNPILKLSGEDNDIDIWNQLPPVFHTETFVKVKPESEILATMKINNVPLREPLIITRSVSNTKSLVFLGYGLYRWKLLGYASSIAKGNNSNIDVLEKFVINSIRWLSIDLDKRLVNIKTNKTQYTEKENIEIFAQVYDKSYNPIDDAIVNIILKGTNQSKEIILNSLGNGRYSGVVERLPEGGYYYSGDVYSNGIKIGSDNGRFSVGELSIEYNDLTMNSKLLRTLSSRTEGKFYLPSEAGNFMKDLINSKHFRPKTLSYRSEISLFINPYLILIIIISLSYEWFLRKRTGMI
jgi:hypothetical protein